MSKISNYGENAIINHLLRNTAITAPTLYVAAHTADPSETGASELAGGNYRRVLLGTCDAAASRATTNTNQIDLPVLLADIGDITHFSIWDAVSGGNMWWYSSEISTHIETASGITPSIEAGSLDISIGGEISTYAANKLLDLIFRGQSFSPPAPYTSLHTSDPGLTGANEVSGNAYARVSVPTWDAPSNGATANTSSITYPTPTPSDWGTITHKGIWDAASGGNFLIAANLDTSFTTTAGQAPVDGAGDFDVVVQ